MQVQPDQMSLLALEQRCMNEIENHRRKEPHKKEERWKYRQYREVRLNTSPEAFFLVAAALYFGGREKPPAFYNLTEPLPPQPAIPDPDRRDVLLAGLLSQHESEAGFEANTTKPSLYCQY